MTLPPVEQLEMMMKMFIACVSACLCVSVCVCVHIIMSKLWWASLRTYLYIEQTHNELCMILSEL